MKIREIPYLTDDSPIQAMRIGHWLGDAKIEWKGFTFFNMDERGWCFTYGDGEDLYSGFPTLFDAMSHAEELDSN